MSLQSYFNINHKNIKRFEGNCQQKPIQVEHLKNLSNKPTIINILEIGFNAGHSSDVFLSSNDTCTVTSFDIGHWHYQSIGKAYIDKTFPKRHTLIIGNSIETIPTFTKENPTIKFDLIFIDGGHTFDVAKNDIINCKKLAHSKTLVIMDDTQITREFNNGPYLAWNECIDEDMIIHERFIDCGDVGMSIGYYK